jgi:signal transduction histidine kinase
VAGDVALATEQLRVLREMAQDALREMRLLVFELRPPVLQQEGLAGALQSRLEAVEGRGGLATEFSAEVTTRLPLEMEEGIYRIAQEALNNVLRHAQARHVLVSLRCDARGVVLEVADDGLGFDPERVRERGGLGLCGMQERAAHMGGEVRVVSRPGEGTRVTLEVCLSQEVHR